MPRQKPSAHDAALNMLARRSHSVKEVARKLHQKGYPPPEIDAVLADFQERNWLNDENFAHGRTRYRATLSKWGPQRIRQELQQAGVAADYIEQALAGMQEVPATDPDHHDFNEAASTLLQRRFGAWPTELTAPPTLPEAKADWYKQRDKEKTRRISFLMRRGFDMATALAALAEQTQAVGEGSEPAP